MTHDIFFSDMKCDLVTKKCVGVAFSVYYTAVGSTHQQINLIKPTKGHTTHTGLKENQFQLASASLSNFILKLSSNLGAQQKF